MAKYSSKVLNIFYNQENAGIIKGYYGLGKYKDIDADEDLKIFLVIESGKISACRYQTSGSIISHAALSVISKIVVGKTVDEANKIVIYDILSSLQQVPKSKFSALVSAIECLKRALKDSSKRSTMTQFSTKVIIKNFSTISKLEILETIQTTENYVEQTIEQQSNTTKFSDDMAFQNVKEYVDKSSAYAQNENEQISNKQLKSTTIVNKNKQTKTNITKSTKNTNQNSTKVVKSKHNLANQYSNKDMTRTNNKLVTNSVSNTTKEKAVPNEIKTDEVVATIDGKKIFKSELDKNNEYHLISENKKIVKITNEVSDASEQKTKTRLREIEEPQKIGNVGSKPTEIEIRVVEDENAIAENDNKDASLLQESDNKSLASLALTPEEEFVLQKSTLSKTKKVVATTKVDENKKESETTPIETNLKTKNGFESIFKTTSTDTNEDTIEDEIDTITAKLTDAISKLNFKFDDDSDK